VIPAGLLLLLALVRAWPDPTVKAHDQEMDQLYAKASQAYTDGRFADAAEYARHAILAGPESPLRFELLCLRGESLLRAGRALESAEAFEEVLRGPPNGPHVPQALFSAAAAREAAGDQAGAMAHRKRLREQFDRTPWAERLRAPAAKP
jgi:TolA-binding protein